MKPNIKKPSIPYIAASVVVSLAVHVVFGVVLLVSFPARPVAQDREMGRTLTVFFPADLPDKESRPEEKREVKKKRKKEPKKERIKEKPAPAKVEEPVPPPREPLSPPPPPAEPEIPFEGPVIAPPVEDVPVIPETEPTPPEPEPEPVPEITDALPEELSIPPPLEDTLVALPDFEAVRESAPLAETVPLLPEPPDLPEEIEVADLLPVLPELAPTMNTPPLPGPVEDHPPVSSEPEEPESEEEDFLPAKEPDILLEGPVVAPPVEEAEEPARLPEAKPAEQVQEESIPPPESRFPEVSEMRPNETIPEPEEAPVEDSVEDEKSEDEEEVPLEDQPSEPPPTLSEVAVPDPPVIIITSPQEGDSLDVVAGSPITIRGAVDDSEVNKVTVIINGNPIEVAVENGVFETRTLQIAAENAISAEATNKAGVIGRSPLIHFSTAVYQPPDIQVILSAAAACRDLDLSLFQGEHPLSPDYRPFKGPHPIEAKAEPLDTDSSSWTVTAEVKAGETAMYTVQLKSHPERTQSECAPRLILILYGYDPDRIRTMVFPVPAPFFGRPETWIVAKFLMPQGYFWDDEGWITGQVDNGTVATKFSSNEEIAWKERR